MKRNQKVGGIRGILRSQESCSFSVNRNDLAKHHTPSTTMMMSISLLCLAPLIFLNLRLLLIYHSYFESSFNKRKNIAL